MNNLTMIEAAIMAVKDNEQIDAMVLGVENKKQIEELLKYFESNKKNIVFKSSQIAEEGLLDPRKWQ